MNLAWHGGLSKTSQGARWSHYIYMTSGTELILPVWPDCTMCTLGTSCLLLFPEARVCTNMLRPLNRTHKNTFRNFFVFVVVSNSTSVILQWFRRSWPKANWLHEGYVHKDVFVFCFFSYLCLAFYFFSLGGGGYRTQQTVTQQE